MERLTHKRENGIKRGYWSPNKKQELVDRLAMYEDREDAKNTNVLGKWIPCSERLPKDRQIVVADIECSIEGRMCIFAYLKIVDYMGVLDKCQYRFSCSSQCCSVDAIAGIIQGGTA